MKKDSDKFITLYPEKGPPLELLRDEFEKEYLPRLLRGAWNDSNALARLLKTAIEDGFFTSLLEFSKRLYEIDTDKVRGLCIYADVLIRHKLLDQAQSLLQSHPEKNGHVLVNLAKVYFDKNQEEHGMKCLEEAVNIDPNLDPGLKWYLSLLNQKMGSAICESKIFDLTQKKISWRPQLWLARKLLEEKRLAEAVSIYRYLVRTFTPLHQDAMIHISGDLGRNGYGDQIMDICFSIYEPEFHGILPAVNIIQSCLIHLKKNKAQEILDRVKNLKLPEWEKRIFELQAQIDDHG